MPSSLGFLVSRYGRRPWIFSCTGFISEVRKFLGRLSYLSLEQLDIGFRRWVGYYGGLFAVRVNRLVYEGPNSRDRCVETGKVVVCCLYGQINDIALPILGYLKPSWQFLASPPYVRRRQIWIGVLRSCYNEIRRCMTREILFSAGVL